MEQLEYNEILMKMACLELCLCIYFLPSISKSFGHSSFCPKNCTVSFNFIWLQMNPSLESEANITGPLSFSCKTLQYDPLGMASLFMDL